MNLYCLTLLIMSAVTGVMGALVAVVMVTAESRDAFAYHDVFARFAIVMCFVLSAGFFGAAIYEVVIR